ncbi:MAG: amidohydrolase family protein [Dermatophilaceae bacterium]|nr:amidohydrolase [Intrasporangiaceae bacterium]
MSSPSFELPAHEAEQIRSRLADHGIPGIIDVHTHFMPDQVMRKVWSYFDQAGPLTGRAWPIAYRAAEAERLAALRSFGLRGFTSLCYPHKPGMARWLNTWTAEFADANPDCIRSGTFFPEPGAGEYVRAATVDGVRIFKAHVQVGGYDPNDPLLDEVWEALQDSGIPLVLHGGDGPAPGEFTGHSHVRRLLDRYPRLTLVIAHMGMPEYAEFLDLTTEFPGVHLDTTMAFTRFTEEQHPFPRALKGVLLERGDRILFGSDFPNIPYPYLEALDAVLDLGMGPEWERQVLHDNAGRLLGLSEGTGSAPP